MIIFQLVYGLAIFAATRAYYEDQPPPTARVPVPIPDPNDWRPATSLGTLQGLTTNDLMPNDPATILSMADRFFAERNYAQAARYYERLVGLDPDNAVIRNNLGLTLHYTGRSAEALAMLGENVAAHPDHQRSWLTLGYVNSQTGDFAAARQALETAVRLDAASDVGRSAQSMLDAL